MRRITVFLIVGFLLLNLPSAANATLITIGTADYDSNGNGIIEANESYNLIWDDDNNGNSVVGLDIPQMFLPHLCIRLHSQGDNWGWEPQVP